MGRCTVYIDIVDILGLQTRIFKSGFHNELGAQSLGVRCGDMICVGAFALAYHLSIYLGTTGLGMLQLLEYETAGALAHHKSITAGAERTRSVLRVVVAG